VLEGAVAPRATPDCELDDPRRLDRTKATTRITTAITAPAPSHGKARDRGVDDLGTGRLDRRLPFIEVLSANSSTGPWALTPIRSVADKRSS
jgi:hypothetical protein